MLTTITTLLQTAHNRLTFTYLSGTYLASQIPSSSVVFLQCILFALDFHFNFMPLDVIQMQSQQLIQIVSDILSITVN